MMEELGVDVTVYLWFSRINPKEWKQNGKIRANIKLGQALTYN